MAMDLTNVPEHAKAGLIAMNTGSVLEGKLDQIIDEYRHGKSIRAIAVVDRIFPVCIPAFRVCDRGTHIEALLQCGKRFFDSVLPQSRAIHTPQNARRPKWFFQSQNRWPVFLDSC